MKDKRTLTYTIENTIAPTLGEWLDIHQFPRKTMKELFGAKDYPFKRTHRPRPNRNALNDSL